MNKSDLKNGMFVENRLEHKIRVIGKYFVTDDLEMREFDKYREDLTYALNDKDEDIMKVLDENYNLLWERQEIDWTKVAIDTKVWVRGADDDEWLPRHFAGYSNGLCYAYSEGCTSWTNEKEKSTAILWSQCKLAEEPQELRKEVTLEELREKHNKEHQKHSCTRCYYNEHDENCMFAWLLDNYNVTKK